METLTTALMVYATENVIPRFQQETALETRAAWSKIDQLTDRLKALSPEAERHITQLEKELLTLENNFERAALLAGLSIGLELGRL